VDDKKLQHFFNNVMIYLGHHEWVLNLNNGTDSYCWKQQKQIDIGINYNGDIRQIILHEIVHINTAKFCNQKHNYDFWNKLKYLTHKFLKRNLDEHQKLHHQYTSQGFYSLKYKH
jgi:hypothetical protein